MKHKKRHFRSAVRRSSTRFPVSSQTTPATNGRHDPVDPLESILRRILADLSRLDQRQASEFRRLAELRQQVDRLSRQILEQILAAQSASSVAKTLSQELARFVSDQANALEFRSRVLDSAGFAFEAARAPRSKGEPGLDHEPRDSTAARLYLELRDALALANIQAVLPATIDPTRARYRVVLTDVPEEHNLVEVEAPAFIHEDAGRSVTLRPAKAVLYRYAGPLTTDNEEETH